MQLFTHVLQEGSLVWASYGACAGNAGNVLPATVGKRSLSCITARAWRMCRDACRDRPSADEVTLKDLDQVVIEFVEWT